MKFGFFLITLVSMVCLPFDSTATAQVYQLTPLPIQYARAINDSGAIVGDATLWENGVSISTAPVYGAGINNNRQVVGSALVSPDTIHAFLWDDNILTDLGTLGGRQATAEAINDSAEVAGYSYTLQSIHPFYWKNGVMTDIGAPGIAEGINDSGRVAGTYSVDDTTRHAFTWQNNSMSDLGTLPGAYFSYARSINNAGQVVGTSSLVGHSGAVAVSWSGGGIINLGRFLDSLWATSDAFDINDAGEIVGTSTVGGTWYSPKGAAFLWKNGVMTNLNSVTDTSGGWDLGTAVGINNKGDIICWAVRQGYSYIESVLLKRRDLLLTEPRGEERWISGDQDTIRWISGLGAGAQVILWYSLNDGQTWRLIDNSIPADTGEYVWTVPDTLSTKVRVMVQSQTDPTKADTSNLFRIKGYVLTRFSPTGDYVAYNPATDRWGLGNFPEDVWPASWYNRFDYSGTDPFTGRNYLLGGLITSAVFLTAQSSDHPDWPAFVNAFQTYQCYVYLPLGVYSPTAVMRWRSIKDSWGGSCFGFAISNAWVFRERTSFFNTYSHFPNFSSPIEVHSDTNVIPVMNSLFVHQFGDPHKSHTNNMSETKTPRETLADLKSMLASDDEPVRSLTIFNNGPGGGGHAIVAHKLRRDPLQGHLYHLSVYDNSYPAETGAEIVFDTTAYAGQGGWAYPLWPGWGGSKWILLMDPAADYWNPPRLSAFEPGKRVSAFSLPDTIVNVHTGSKSEVLIRDKAGNITGFVDSLIRSEIPGSVPLTVQNGSRQPPYGYSLRVRPYSVALQEFTDPTSRAYFFTGDRSFSVERSGATSAQTDRFTFDGNVSIVNSDTAAKSYDIVNILREFSQSREKVFSVRSLTLRENDSVRVANINTDGLKLSSFDSTAKTYRLTIENYVWTGLRQFTHSDVPLQGNSSHIIRPDWGNITPTTQITILIDLENNGTIDDSIIVSNEITGTHDMFGGIPSEFKLYQNYPNPFNPTTSIAYDLPKAAHAVLTIYNVLGQQVAVLVNEVQDAGYKTVEWNATGMPSGVYFYQLRAGWFAQTRKMLLLK